MRLQKNQALTELVANFEANQLAGTSNFLQDFEFRQLVHYYECLRQQDQVLEVLDLAVEQHPYSSTLLLQKAEFLLSIHKEKEALAVLDLAEPLSPTSFEVLLLRVEALTCLGELELAWLFIRELPEPKDRFQQADFWLAKASWYEHQLAYDKMYAYLLDAIRLCPEHTRAIEKFGIAVELTKKHADSIDRHKAIIDNDPYSYQAWFNLGQAYFYEGFYDEAIEAYEYAFIIDPHFDLAYREYIDLCFGLKHYKQVLSCYEDLVNYWPLDTDDLLLIGQCYYHIGALDKAQSIYEKAVQMDAFNEEIYFHTAECLAKQNDWIGALHYYTRAIEIEPHREEYFAARGEAYFMIDAVTKAENDFIRATNIAPDESQYWIQYCSFLMQQERAYYALELLDGLMETCDVELMYCRIACLFLLGRRKEAIYWLIEALSEDFDAHNVLFELIPDLAADDDLSATINSHYHQRY